MGKPSEEQIAAWLAAAGKSGKVPPAVRDKIITAAQFIENTARQRDASGFLKGIDFSKEVKVLNKLPNKVFVQYVGKHKGMWFTETGLTPDLVGIAEGSETTKRLRKLYKPSGNVAALKSTASSVKDTWTIEKVLKIKDPAVKKKVMTRGGGTQYIVANPQKMTLI
ncbi:MAG: polymorphic toxin type 46 domain-containing protein [Planctomycetota bacterium]